MLAAFNETLHALGIQSFVAMQEKSGDYEHENRIKILADVRNRALEPLFGLQQQNVLFTKVVFLNDGKQKPSQPPDSIFFSAHVNKMLTQASTAQ
jgi:hypothetical protein